MAAITLPDVILSNSAYIDIYAATGIPVGTSLIVQNKGSSGYYLQLKETQPSATNSDGNILAAMEFLIIKTTSPIRFWARGSGRLSVQVEE